MILVADIGGSNTRLALADVSPDGVTLHDRTAYANAEATSLGDLLARYLADRPRPERACLAVAGPTDGRTVALTNLDWRIDADALAGEFGLPCRLVNDFEAVAWGLAALTPDGLASLQDGRADAGAPRLALGPGTGLGVALGIGAGAGYRALPGEGGHIGFAPTNAEQTSLLRHMQALYGRVSVERILSGSGIADLFAFCRAGSGRPVKRARTPAEVTDAALAGSDPIAAWAMRLFCRILGQTAGDLALVAGARAGVYIAGGIPPRILPLLQDGEFLAGLRDKGRFSDWTAGLPVHVVTDPDVGLKGAALAAR
ncbi:glucokinase [Parasulfuritortus cantonensis]|uniref:Glucokinase n=1 Tax=Parasulfuritortus cantonensis TaxID=2528202 RepID=A0A4R1BE24_9PROT|nr:glucokinase [Parasulfuritortus cantonensis]TCJ15350.1 glucokinase [Parasulfuritortus cantonensis]